MNPNIYTGIFANSFWTGRGGEIQVNSSGLSMAQHALIGAASISRGDAGNATVNTGRLDMSSGSSIYTNSLYGSGNAGNISVNADTIVITGVRDSANPFGSVADYTGLSSTTGVNGKNGGDISVVANSVTLTGKGAISSASLGAGDAGKIRIDAGRLVVSGRAQIESNAFGSGRGGNIEIRANDVTVSGAGAPLGPSDSPISAIGSQAGGSGGAAGDITIAAGSLQVLDGAKVTTQTFGPGKGGNLSVEAGSVIVSGINGSLEAYLRSVNQDPAGANSAIAASSEAFLLGDRATGNAGNVRISGGDVQVTAGGVISSRTNTPGLGGTIEVSADRVSFAGGALITAESSTSPIAGKAGDISLNAREAVQIGASSVTTASDGAGGGAITIAANRVQLDPGAIISARATGAGNAGNITITAGDTLVARGSTVSTQAAQSDGGNVTLTAPTMVQLIDSTITTSVGTGQGKGGNITIDPQFVILDRSQIRADAFGGPGGNISISADVFLTQQSVMSASSALSAPGTIDIQAGITDISGNVARLPESAPPVAALLRASCAARMSGGSVSSLVVAGREGLPPDPEGVLPSPLLAEGSWTPARLAEPLAYRVDELPTLSLLAGDRLCSGLRVR
jgi:large exoprotein involved in heme utilization and adhesion